MFGYVIANKAEMKFKEYDVYRSYYCGLCRAMKDRCGNLARLSLSYDMAFVYMLLSGLYEPETKMQQCRCALHPFEKINYTENSIGEYVADMSLLMTYYKCKDDWDDEKKINKGLLMTALKGKYKKLGAFYEDKILQMENLFEELRRGENRGSVDVDYMSGLFGNIMSLVMVQKEDEWAPMLGRMGFFLGKFIYLMDAYEDIEEDLKKCQYNPLLKLYQSPDFEGECQQILTMMMGECCREFEKMPIIENVDILRNILYSGVWVRYETVHARREEMAKETMKSSMAPVEEKIEVTDHE
ncbi:MAG: hypothetical protein IJY10_08255 [Lachnospiraceae bacterium]|nr:hypothetical protein [Lachnospiraceae bacterium]